MLHILLLILKIIGIILAVILGILILMFCIVLFMPVRYEMSGSCGGSLESLEVKLKITWLIHLVRADIYYKQQRFRWRVRAAWVKRSSGYKEQIEEENKYEKTQSEENEHEEASEVLESKEEVLKECEESRNEPEKSTEEDTKGMETADEKESRYAEDSEIPQGPQEIMEGRESIWEKIKGIIQGITQRIKTLLQKIKCTFRNLCDKIKVLKQKKDKLAEFILDEIHVDAFRRVKKELFGLLRRLRPKKITADVQYGFGDPCMTGQVLAGLCMLYPVIGECVNILPDFENRTLKGKIYIRGKIHGYYFLILCWNLVWSKNIRLTYRHIKNFEL